jgi:hypothetical protein
MTAPGPLVFSCVSSYVANFLLLATMLKIHSRANAEGGKKRKA